MIRALSILRSEYRFNGYIHAKAIPGTSPELVEQLGFLSDRLSVNIELPSEAGLKLLAPNKTKQAILRRHFCERYHNETFFLYDRTHREALLYSGGVSRIVPLNHFEMAQPDEVEAGYRRLWRRFYDTVAIEARKNEKLRMTHMPKRYWGMMTEFQDESYFKARPKETPSASPAPGAPAAIPAPATRPEGAPPAPASAP